MVNFLAEATIDVCGDNLIWILKVARLVITIISIAAPFALIIFGSLDFFKAIIAGDEKEMKAKRKPFVGRLVAAIVILILPGLINLVMSTLAGQNNTFARCWTAAKVTGGKVPLPDIDY